MSILYTSKELIDFCLPREFARNNIRHTKSRISNLCLHDMESVIQIQDKNVAILQQNPKQDDTRLNFVLSLFKFVLDKLPDTKNFDFIFILNVGDGVNLDERYTRLCFSHNKDSNHISIPDPSIYLELIFQNHISSIIAVDIPWEEKINSCIFRGSDTGKIRENLLNQRIQFCHRNQSVQGLDAKITQFVHFTEEMLVDKKIIKSQIEAPNCPVKEQLKYKYILNINGNTASWSRVVWSMATNSYVIQLKLRKEEDDYCWYYHFLKNKNILPEIKEDNFAKEFQEIQNSNTYPIVKKKQKDLAALLLSFRTLQTYTEEVLKQYNYIYNS